MTQTLVADQQPESPIEPTPPKKRKPLVLIVALVAAAMAVAIVALTVLGALFLGGRNLESMGTALPDRVALDTVEGAPDAAWVVVKTFDGYRIAAESVEDIGYVQWVGASDSGSEAQTVVVLDAAFNELWQHST